MTHFQFIFTVRLKEKEELATSRFKLYRRWHGCGLLSLSALGALVLWNDKVQDETTKSTTAVVLFLFHFGASAVHFLGVGNEISCKETLSDLA